MKSFICSISLIFLIFPSVLLSSELPLSGEVARAEAILESHFNHCGPGVSGWWLKLDTSPDSTAQYGGVSTHSGEYHGCGTCDQCRNALRSAIAGIVSSKTQHCRSRGGQVKSVNNGTWSEEIKPTSWTMRASGIDIVCEKWIPCD